MGDPQWLSRLGGTRLELAQYIEPAGTSGNNNDSLHVLHVPQSVAMRLWHWLATGKQKS